MSDRETLMEVKYSDHPGDKHLRWVLCRFNGKLVTWARNLQSRGDSSGNYFPDTVDGLIAAAKDLKVRSTR